MEADGMLKWQACYEEQYPCEVSTTDVLTREEQGFHINHYVAQLGRARWEMGVVRFKS